MSLSPKNLAQIQKAGQAVHAAAQGIAATVRTQAESMVANMASQPFSIESEQAIARFKVLARLNQGLAAVESQLLELYGIAAELANPASDVIVLPDSGERRAVANAAAEDVVAKPARPAKRTRKPRQGASLSANDAKLLHYLQGALAVGESRKLTTATMAREAGLPLGSVGVSLRKLLAAGAVKLVGRGTYRLPAVARA